MFLSYAVVPVLVFTVLLNFFYLYAPIDSLQCGQNYTCCEECLNSTCHTQMNRTCTINPDNSTYSCFTCDPDPSGNPQYYSEAECKATCTDPAKMCICDGACWSCMVTEGTDLAKFVCAMPTQAVDEKCAVVPYGSNCSAPATSGA
ncbi:uncharacterized protein LOC132952721 [Metopolophium dirhodum]|uniref:uncharacterized protein LOC132952721 n=1 Tax=Metopolophium dirhodum TaxID=44670 RepID=UPI00298F73FD|nr:uncharacterized protein LOC132952721 [Metopolophium dirhodum]